MAEERQVPGPARDNNERIQERGYESEFARLPEEEVDPISGPGAGPHGSLDRGARNLPLMVIGLGAIVAFTAFGLDTAVPLVLGLLLVVVGAVWAGMRSTTHASGLGSGTSTVSTDDKE